MLAPSLSSLLEHNSGQRRDTTRVIYDILSVARKSSSKYGIISKANLRFSKAEGFLYFLLDKGDLELKTDGTGVNRYTITPNGELLRVYLKRIQDHLEGLIDSFTRDTPTPALAQLVVKNRVDRRKPLAPVQQDNSSRLSY